MRSDETFVAGGGGEGRGWRNRMSRMNAKTLLAIIINTNINTNQKKMFVLGTGSEI